MEQIFRKAGNIVKIVLTGTDEHNIMSKLEIDADLTNQEDIEYAILKYLLFLEKNGAEFPEEFQEFVEDLYER
jgi:DNA-binding protein YbaB